MKAHARYLAPQIQKDLARKMVFVSGPRQVGKTTLARSLPGAKDGYLNWDVQERSLKVTFLDDTTLPGLAVDFWIKFARSGDLAGQAMSRHYIATIHIMRGDLTRAMVGMLRTGDEFEVIASQYALVDATRIHGAGAPVVPTVAKRGQGIDQLL